MWAPANTSWPKDNPEEIHGASSAISFLYLLPLGAVGTRVGWKDAAFFWFFNLSGAATIEIPSVFYLFFCLSTSTSLAESAEALYEENEHGVKEFIEKKLVTCKLLEVAFVK